MFLLVVGALELGHIAVVAWRVEFVSCVYFGFEVVQANVGSGVDLLGGGSWCLMVVLLHAAQEVVVLDVLVWLLDSLHLSGTRRLLRLLVARRHMRLLEQHLLQII